MKDLQTEAGKVETVNQKAQREGAPNRQLMHDYKGFTVEPVIGGFTIVIYGRKHILYIAGPSGWRLTEDMRQARAFRDLKTCHDLIDEMIADWQGWIDSVPAPKQRTTQGVVM